MYEYPKHSPRVAVVALRRSIHGDPIPIVFGNYKKANYSISAWKSLRATSAAPFFFEQVEHDNFFYIDGGVGKNNPSLVAYLETIKLWPSESISLFLSLGTGKIGTSDSFFYLILQLILKM